MVGLIKGNSLTPKNSLKGDDGGGNRLRKCYLQHDCSGAGACGGVSVDSWPQESYDGVSLVGRDSLATAQSGGDTRVEKSEKCGKISKK